MTDFADVHDELREVARAALGRVEPASEVPWSAAVDLGWSSLEVPGRLGGAGATFAETAVVLEECARAIVATPIFGTVVAGVGVLSNVVPGVGPDALLSGIVDGSTTIAAVWASSGDDAEPERAPFTWRDGRLDGAASHVVDALDATHVLALARDGDGGTVVLAVDAGSLAIAPTVVLDETRSLAAVTADRLEVDPTRVWTIDADATAVLGALADRAALALAIDAWAVTAAVLDRTVEYVSERRQFDRPIGSFQAVQHQCADVAVSLALGRELLDTAIAATVIDDPDRGVEVARAKSFVGEAAVSAVGVAIQLHGGIGYTWESGLHRYMKRAMLDRALGGSPSAHRARVAAALRR